jgi:hypothetical protein
MGKRKFKIFPPERMGIDFPWQIWAAGWLCIFKGLIWLAYEPNLPDSTLTLLAYKYGLEMIPLILFGIGIWNLRKWAVWGALVVCGLNLIFYPLQSAGFQRFCSKIRSPALVGPAVDCDFDLQRPAGRCVDPARRTFLT